MLAILKAYLVFMNKQSLNLKKKQLFDYLQTLSNSLTNTINNLNEIVTVQSKQKAHTDKLYISKEIQLILKELDYFIKDNNATVVNKTELDCYLFFNTSYFQSILQNLILNAIKYKHPKRDPEISIVSSCSKNAIEIKVSDNGLGINLDRFGKDIFGLYKTFHTNHDSEGVGLYLVKNQIEAFGGTITVNSKVNIGTTFIINIPKPIA